MGWNVETEVVAPVYFEGERLDGAFRLDMLVGGAVIVELKAVEALHPVHFAQLRSYLQLTGREVGLLVHFRSPRLKDGLHRLVVRPIPQSP